MGFRYVGMSWSSYFEGDQQPQKLSMKKSWGAGMAVENTGSGLARWVLLSRAPKHDVHQVLNTKQMLAGAGEGG